MKNRRNGFTLIELVVVIMILGILAGVAAPKLLSVSSDATDNGLKQTLSILRDAVELYAAENGGALPPCTATGTDFRAAVQSYIRGTFPSCPVGAAGNKNFNVVPTGAGATIADSPSKDGWKFNTADGTIICNFGGATASDASITYDSY